MKTNRFFVEYRPIKSHPSYQIGDDGSVRIQTKGIWRHLSLITTRHGYMVVSLHNNGVKTQRRVHQLVLEAFIGPRSPGQITRHLNGCRADNRLENLTWGTHKENEFDKDRHGTKMRGVKNHQHRLTPPEVIRIRNLLSQGFSDKQISKQFQVTATAIRYIRIGRNWNHLK